jgi:hypothetical protein
VVRDKNHAPRTTHDAMTIQVTYHQLNKDYLFWTEKRRFGQMNGGHVSGLVTHSIDGVVQQRILVDCGLGTLVSIADYLPDSFWDDPLVIFITHGHIDHHAELMVIAEMYCQRRGNHWREVRPPVTVYATAGTFEHLDRTHWWGFRGGNSLTHQLIMPLEPVIFDPITITPIPVEHFLDSVNYLIEFELSQPHKIFIGWDMTTVPLDTVPLVAQPSLAFFDSTTWAEPNVDHICIEDLVGSGFLPSMKLDYAPEKQKYGGYMVHYSGWEDSFGMMSDQALKEKFDDSFPELANVVRVAQRGQSWIFD